MNVFQKILAAVLIQVTMKQQKEKTQQLSQKQVLHVFLLWYIVLGAVENTDF